MNGLCQKFEAKNENIRITWGPARGLHFYRNSDCTGSNETIIDEKWATTPPPVSCIDMDKWNGPYGSFQVYNADPRNIEARMAHHKDKGDDEYAPGSVIDYGGDGI